MSKFRNRETNVVVSVADEKDHRFASGWDLYDGTEPDEPIESRTVPQLREYAAENGIDLGEAKKKAEILAVIAAASDEEGDESSEDESSGGEE